MTWVRHKYDTSMTPQIKCSCILTKNSKYTKPLHQRERERERENERSKDADPSGGNMGTEATVKGQGVFGGGFGYCGTCVLACTRERGEDMGKKKRKKKRICSQLFVEMVFWSLNSVT